MYILVNPLTLGDNNIVAQKTAINFDKVQYIYKIDSHTLLVFDNGQKAKLSTPFEEIMEILSKK